MQKHKASSSSRCGSRQEVEEAVLPVGLASLPGILYDVIPYIHMVLTWAWHLSVFWPGNILAAGAVGQLMVRSVNLLDKYLQYFANATQVCVCVSVGVFSLWVLLCCGCADK